MNKKPLIAVVDWKPQPRGDKNCIVEKEAIGDTADVKYFLCDKLEDWKGQVLKADAILVWHNTKITKEVIQDKIEVVGEFKHIQVRTATVIKEDGVELSRSFHRHVVEPDSDSSKESADVKAMVAQFHTDAVKKAYAAHVKAQQPSE